MGCRVVACVALAGVMSASCAALWGFQDGVVAADGAVDAGREAHSERDVATSKDGPTPSDVRDGHAHDSAHDAAQDAMAHPDGDHEASTCADCASSPAGHACVAGQCGCNAASDCAEGEACNASHACTSTCSAADPCNGDCCAVTGPGAGTCATSTAAHCGAGGAVCAACFGPRSKCSDAGACVECLVDADCSGGNRHCANGTCQM